MLNLMEDVTETNIKNLLHDASNLKLLCETRGLEKLDAEKRGFGKNNEIEYTEFFEDSVEIEVIDSKYDLRDTASVSLSIDEICITNEQWKLYLQRL